MTREPAQPVQLDYLIKAGAIHAMTGETYRESIVAQTGSLPPWTLVIEHALLSAPG